MTSPLRSKIALLAAAFLVCGIAAASAEDAKGAPKQPAASSSQDVFGEEVQLPERTLLMRRTRTSWDEAWPGIVDAFKAVRADAERLNLKVTGDPLVIYRSTADDSFEFDAALPIEAAPATPLPAEGDLHAGPARTGKAIKFIYRGAFDAMDGTYELISNYIDSNKIDAEDLSIEEYVTDPVKTNPKEIVLNIYMPLKK
jgi:effector-binding domain-containing protein